MLHILLLILKIIGIVLAVLVGIVLVALICVLFVPIRYQIKADGKLGEKEPVRVKVKVHWLLHIVSAAFSYPEAAYLKVRLFGINVYDGSKKKDKDEEAEETVEEGTADERAEELNSQTENHIEQAEKQKQQNDGQIKQDGEQGRQIESQIESQIEQTEGSNEMTDDTVTPEQEDELSQENGIINRIKAFIHAVKVFFLRIWEALKNIEYTIRKICDKIKQIVENIRYYTDVLKSDVFREAWTVCKKQLLKVLRMLKPQKCKVNLLIGTGDPASTGQVWSVYGMLYPFVGNNVLLQTDFENQIVEGDMYIKGRIRCVVLLLAAFKLYVNKDIRHLLKLLKREEI